MTALRDLLVCPRCRGELAWPDEAAAPDASLASGALACRSCRFVFPLRDGVPRMSDGYLAGDPRMEAEWQAQSNARALYVDQQLIMNQWEREVLPHLLGWIGALGEPGAPGTIDGPVLDVGCGVGHLGDVVATLGRDLELIGLDFQAELLAEARRGYQLLIEGDVQHLPLRDGSIRAAIASNSLHHFPDPELAMREIARVLAPGAPFVAYDPRSVPALDALKKLVRRNDKAFTEDHRSFEVGEYRRLLGSSGLRVIEVTRVDPLGPLVATGLDYLRFGHLGVAQPVAHYLAEADRRLAGSRWDTPFGLMLAGRAVKDG